MIMTRIKKNVPFLLLMLLLLSISLFLFLKERNFTAENEKLSDEVIKLRSEYLKISSTIDHELPSKIEEVQSNIEIIESKFPSLEKELAQKTALLPALKAENDTLTSQLQKKKTKVLGVHSLRNQILVDDRITDSTLVDFLVEFFKTTVDRDYDKNLSMWHVDTDDSFYTTAGVKGWFDNTNFNLRKLNYRKSYSEKPDYFVVIAESHDDDILMIVGDKFDDEWKVLIWD